MFSVGNTQPEATIRRLRCGGEPGALRRVAARIEARLLGFRSVKGSPAFRKRRQRRASARTRSSRPPRSALREDRNGSMPLLENAETAQCRSRTRHHRGPRPRGTNENAGSYDRWAVLGMTITYTTKMTDAPQTSWEYPGSPRGHERSSWRSDRTTFIISEN